jgi:GNAT superfamily N-acetyltransferase
MDFSIREARFKDIPDITRLNAQLGYPESAETIACRFRRLGRDRRNHRVFAAVAGTAVIGWIHVFLDKLLTVGPQAVIGGLVVDEQWRSGGVGVALVSKAEQWAQQKFVFRVVVHTNVVRTRAHAFYEKCGYRLLKQSKVYMKEVN